MSKVNGLESFERIGVMLELADTLSIQTSFPDAPTKLTVATSKPHLLTRYAIRLLKSFW